MIKFIPLVLVLVACTKTKTEVIKTTSSYEIELERQKAFGNRSIDEIKETSFVHKITTQLLTTPDAPLKQLLEESKMLIVKKLETEEYTEIWFNREILDYTLTDKPTFKFKDVARFAKEGSGESQLSGFSLIKSSALVNEKSGSDFSVETVEYSNLQIKDIRVPLPEKVKTKLNCADCTTEAKKISYIATVRNEEGAKKYIAESIISPNVPPLASELSQCLSTLAGVQTIEVLVKHCQEVYDYE